MFLLGWRGFFVGFFATMLLVGLFFWQVSSSLAFLFFLLPSEEVPALAVDFTQREGRLLADYSWGEVLTPLQSYTSSAYRLAASVREGTVATVVVYPHWGSQAVLAAQLEQQGWVVERWGGVLRARRTTFGRLEPVSHLFSSYILSGRWWDRFSYFALARLPSAPAWGLEGEIMVTGKARDGEGYVRIHHEADKPHITWSFEDFPPVSSDEHVRISLPGSLIQERGQRALLDTIDQELHSSFGFVYSRPGIAKELSHYSWVFLQLDGEPVLGIEGEADRFMEAAKGWLMTEEQRGRKIMRSFRLPDGSFGQEYVPGSPEPIVAASDDYPACLAPVEGKTVWWLCRYGTRAFITKNPGKSESLSREPWVQPSMAASKTWLDRFVPLPFQGLSATVTRDSIIFIHVLL